MRKGYDNFIIVEFLYGLINVMGFLNFGWKGFFEMVEGYSFDFFFIVFIFGGMLEEFVFLVEKLSEVVDVLSLICFVFMLRVMVWR